MFLQILNNLADVFYVGSAICFGWMAPKIWDLFKRDLAKVAGNEQKFNELRKVTQKNADEIEAIIKAPVKIFHKLRKIHTETFPMQIVQAGVIGKDIKKIRKGNTPRALKSNKIKKTGGDSADPDGDGDGEPPRNHLQLLDEQALAYLLIISKKSVQNQYSATPWLLPAAIQIPGARGPRWTAQCVQDWLDDRPQHTPKTAPPAPKNRKVGRPRIAQMNGNGGAA